MQVYPESQNDNVTIFNQKQNSLRKLHISKTSRNLIPLYNPPSIESRITLSRSDSHALFSLQSSSNKLIRPFNKRDFRLIVRKLIHAQNFIKELRSYAEQLRSQHMDYLYRHRNIFPLYPDEISYKIWIFCSKLLHFLSSILLPFQIAFQGIGIIGMQIITILFIIDIIFNFISCHITKDNVLIHKFWDIIFHYIKGWFILDVLSIIPFEQSDSTVIFSLFRFFRIIKYFFVEQKENYIITSDIIQKKDDNITEDLHYKDDIMFDVRIRRMINIFFDMLILAHIFGCLWCWSARVIKQNNWIDNEDIENETIWSKYLYGFYWALQTITVIGYGDIAAHTSLEYTISIIWMLIGVGFYSFTIGDITYILASVNPRQEFIEQKALIESLSDSIIIETVYQDLLNFCSFNISHNPFWAKNTIDMIGKLPLNLQQYIVTATYRDIFRLVPFIANDLNFASRILPYCTFSKFEEYTTIYHIGQSASDFYFLLSGDVRISDSSGETIMRVMEGTVFGEIESIEQSLRRWHAHAVTTSIILMCPGRFFEFLIKENSTQFFELFQMYKRRKILLQNYNEERQKQAGKLKRSNALILESKIIRTEKKRKTSEYKIQFKSKIDCRNYISVQQDLMLQVVGQKQARKKLLKEKFKLSVDRIRQLIIRNNNRRGALSQDPDYKIIKDLIITRSNTTIVTTNGYDSKNYLQKLMKKFGNMVEVENQVQSFIIRKKQESIEKIKRIKLTDMLQNWNKNKRRDSIRREIDVYYSQFHEQIYQEILTNRAEQKIKLKQKSESITKKQITKFQNFNKNLDEILALSTKCSINKFDILQIERDIDDIIDECQSLIQFIL